MKDQFQGLIEFLKTPFPYFFLIASLGVSTFLLSYKEFVKSIYDKEKAISLSEANKNDGIIYRPEGESHFTVCACTTCRSDVSELEMVEGLARGFGTLLSFPAFIATLIFIGGLQIDFPNLSPQTFELFAIISFIYFNLNFWLLLAYTIRKIHDNLAERYPPPKPILSILPK